MTAFVADARDRGFPTVRRWAASVLAGGDELVLLGANAISAQEIEALSALADAGVAVAQVDDASYLPGADRALCALGTPALSRLAERAAIEMIACGEPDATPFDDIPRTGDDVRERIRDLPGDIDEPEALLLYALARRAPAPIVVFDSAGRSAVAVAAGAAAGGSPPPTVVVDPVEGVARAVRDRRTALEANLRAAGVTDGVVVSDYAPGGLPDGGEGLGLVVMPRELEYMTAHAIIHALGRSIGSGTTIVRPRPHVGAPGGGLAFTELVAQRALPPCLGCLGSLDVHTEEPLEEFELEKAHPRTVGSAPAGGPTDRKSESESPDSKHFLSVRHIEAFVTEHGQRLIGRIIDHGCGNKPYSNLLPNAATLVGVDIEQSSERRVDVLVGPRDELSFPSGWFDGGLCTEVLEHCEEPGTVLAELGRVIRSGGHLIVTAPFVWPLHEEPRDFFRFSPHGLRYLLDRAGFDVAAESSGGGLWEVLYQLQTALIDGDTQPERDRIAKLNAEAATRDRDDHRPEISTHFPILGLRR